jgi:meiotic recombination protein SPO11
MSTYKYGSIAHLHDNARLSLPGMEWLGLKAADAILASESPGASEVLSLAPSDRRKVLAMLRNNPVWSNDGPEPEWRSELQRMLFLNIKAEIEMLYERDGGLEAWIDRKLFRQE